MREVIISKLATRKLGGGWPYSDVAKNSETTLLETTHVVPELPGLLWLLCCSDEFAHQGMRGTMMGVITLTCTGQIANAMSNLLRSMFDPMHHIYLGPSGRCDSK